MSCHCIDKVAVGGETRLFMCCIGHYCSPLHTALRVLGSCTNPQHPPLCKSLMQWGVKFHSGADTPLEVVSEAQCWQTCWSDGVHSLIIKQIIHSSQKKKRNFPQSNITGPNKSNILIVTVITTVTWSICPPTWPTNSSSHFCPSVWAEKKITTIILSGTSVNFPPETPPPRKWQSQTRSSLLMVIM